MFKSNWSKYLSVILLILISLGIIGCESLPENELTDIDNVITEKQKKQAAAEEKATQAAKVTQAEPKTADNPNQSAYPMVTPTPILKPIPTPIPAPVATTPASTANQQVQNPEEKTKTA